MKPLLLIWSVTLALFCASCTDVDIFEITAGGAGQRDNKLLVEGTFCTEHPDELDFPVKIMFIIDCSQSTAVTDPPPTPNDYPGRIEAVWNVIQKYRNDPGVEFAILRFEGTANVATQQDTNGDGINDMFGFVNDLPALLRGLNALNVSNGQTSYQSALGLAEATLAMDMSNINANQRARTKYVVIFLSDGLPYPQDVGSDNNTPFGIRRAVRDIMKLAKRFDVADLTFHTAFLAVDTPSWVEQEAEDLLKGMAEDGQGTYRSFPNGESINFLDIDFTSVKRVYSLKDGAFMVYNKNAFPSWIAQEAIDTDGDGLVDYQERELGTNIGDIDTDHDGFSDLLEYSLRTSGFDPLDPNDADCSLLLDRIDADGDTLLACEERFLGTSPDMFDTDEDGIPDSIEVLAGTNPVFSDADVDLDFDGTRNASEVAWHTNPLLNDAQRYSKLAYRYKLGRQPGIFESRLCYDFEVDNITLVGTDARTEGGPKGYNDIMVYTGQIPYDDPDDAGVFRVACARVRYIPRDNNPDIKYPPNGKIRFELSDFKRPIAQSCSADEECPYHICDPQDHLCLSPLGDGCDEQNPCPHFECEATISGQSYCNYPVASACLEDRDCPNYPIDPETGLCLDPAGSSPDPITQECPQRPCIPQYQACAVASDCQDFDVSQTDGNPVCLAGFCRKPCSQAFDCNPGETCEPDPTDVYQPCAGAADCSAPSVCTQGICKLPCVVATDCPGSNYTCENGYCSGFHCVDHHGGTCAQIPCTSDNQCPRQVCDEEVHRCKTQPCLDSRQCPHQHCEQILGFCIGDACSDDRDCRGERGYTCNSVIGQSCDLDIDCAFNLCSLELRTCSQNFKACSDQDPCDLNTCNLTQGRCRVTNDPCTQDLDCIPNICESEIVCANDPSKRCVVSMDCPRTFCHVDKYCINNPNISCNPATENTDNRCQVGMCSRENDLGQCDTALGELCVNKTDCPNYRCNLATGICDYPSQLVCQNDSVCPDGLSCHIPAGEQWGSCQKTCTGDYECPHAYCKGRCRPQNEAQANRCSDWFDPQRDCKVYDGY